MAFEIIGLTSGRVHVIRDHKSIPF